MMFPCTKCGCCCKRIDIAVNNMNHLTDVYPAISKFPYKWDETGRCEQLGEDNKCKVYENRPLLCRIDEVGELMNYEQGEWYKMNAEACNHMMKEDKVDKSLRVNL